MYNAEGNVWNFKELWAAGTVNVKLSTLGLTGQNVEQKNKRKILNPSTKKKEVSYVNDQISEEHEFSTPIFSICAKTSSCISFNVSK